jgi:CBS domain-containing protein
MTTDPRRTAAPPETLDDDPPITQLMTRQLVAITHDSSLSTALRLMASTRVRHLPVLDGPRCLGVVAEVDLSRFVAGGSGSPAARARVPVRELTRPVEPLPVTARRSDVARRMQAGYLDAVLVIDRRRLVGIVTTTDLVRSLVGVHADAGHHGTPS